MRLRTAAAATALAATAVLGGAGAAAADSDAEGAAADSPGVLSGNNLEVPVHLPVNACGDSVNVLGALNPTSGNGCANS